MKKLGTVLLLAISLMTVTACGKKKDNQAANYNCNGLYQTTPCGMYGQNGMYGQQQYGGQMCQAGSVQTQMGCLQQGPCMSGYGYHPTALNGGPGCVQGTMGGYQQPYQQQYGGGGYYGGGYGGFGY